LKGVVWKDATFPPKEGARQSAAATVAGKCPDHIIYTVTLVTF
jgi:hypothetical protein